MLSSYFLLPTFYTPWQATVWEVIANFGRNRNTLPSASEPELHRAHLASQSLGRRQGRTTGHEGPPHTTGSKLVGDSPGVIALREEHPTLRGAGLPPATTGCLAQATTFTPTHNSSALCEPNWLVHLKESAQEPLL